MSPEVRFTSCLAGSVIALLLLSACSSGGEATGESGEDPIKISVIGDVDASAIGVTTPQLEQGAKAAVAAINDDGGVNGRPLELTVCNTQGDPNVAATCARDSIDRGDVATVGTFSITGGVTPVFTAADVPMVGNFAQAQEDFESPMSYPLVGGSTIAGTCSVSVLADELDAKAISVLYIETPAAASANDILDRALKARDLTALRYTPVPVNATDLAPYLTQAAEGSDGLVLVADPGTAARAVQSARGIGLDIPIAAISLTQSQLEELGDASENLLQCFMLRPVATGGAGVDEMLAEMKAIDATADLDDVGANAWLSVHVFAQVAAGLDDVTPASVAEAMNTLTDGDGLGLSPEINTSEPFEGTADVWPRLFNPTVWYAQIEDGKVVLLQDEPVNPFLTD